ncbi:MAG TPA: PaaI family thioesterase [Solimonas sp.]
MSPLERLLPFVLQHPLHRAMGVTTIDAQDGKAQLEIEVGGDAVNAAGVFHGGIAYCLADMVCYAALLSVLDDGENAVTHDIHVSMLRGARRGDRIRFEGRVLKRGRNVAFMESQAWCGDHLIARATVTKSVIRMADAPTPG